jgi:hypothetical protein
LVIEWATPDDSSFGKSMAESTKAPVIDAAAASKPNKRQKIN